MAKHIFSTNQKHALGKRRCALCTSQMKDVDYKDIKTLSHFLDGFKRIKNRYYSGVCLKHQKKLSTAIKRGRHVALLPFTN